MKAKLNKTIKITLNRIHIQVIYLQHFSSYSVIVIIIIINEYYKYN